MVAPGSILFLLGTSILVAYTEAFIPSMPHKVPTEIVIAKHKPSKENVIEFFGQPGYLPFISNFLQKGTNVFFKPQFLLSPTIIPPPTLVDCNPSPLIPGLPVPPVPGNAIVEEPLRIVETTFPVANDHVSHVEEIIEIRPIAVPQLTVLPEPILPVEIVQDSIIQMEEVKPITIPEAPVLPPLPLPLPEIPVAVSVESVVNVTAQEHHAIPEAPELPSFSLPELPLPVVVEVSQGSVVEDHKVIQQSIIPDGPELPPLSLPELPIPVRVPSLPSVVVECSEIKEIIPAPPVIPEPQEEVLIEEIPIEIPAISLPVYIEESLHIPHAPELPPLPVPELPVNVVVEEQGPVVEIQEYVKPTIPEAPVLPPLAPVLMPGPMPIFIEETKVPIIPSSQLPTLPLHILPTPPKLHVLENVFRPYLPGIIAPQHMSFIKNQFVMSSMPQSDILSFPTACVQDIVVKRVLPNIIHEQNIELRHDIPILPDPYPHFLPVEYPQY